jgi:hypothetical protein
MNVKPGTTRQDRAERTQQHSVRMTPKPRKGTRTARKNRAIEENRSGE